MAEGEIPRDQKKAAACRGVVLFEDEASFWLDGTLHRTWARIGHQPRVDTFGQRKTAHIYGAVSLSGARFTFRFEEVFNGMTFLAFLKQIVAKYRGQKVFLIMDNGPCHNLDEDGKRWLKENSTRLALFRLPPYSPEFNPMEPVWKTTRKLATHNRFYRTTQERDAALRKTFRTFRRRPALIAAHVARYR
ncbi:MAG: IS630 family transposase [Deltaproteobacteria bacterium]|nr:IS630 family transposase [Deltaproteobacteria bacterium]